MAWGWVHFQQFFILGWDIALKGECINAREGRYCRAEGNYTWTEQFIWIPIHLHLLSLHMTPLEVRALNSADL